MILRQIEVFRKFKALDAGPGRVRDVVLGEHPEDLRVGGASWLGESVVDPQDQKRVDYKTRRSIQAYGCDSRSRRFC